MSDIKYSLEIMRDEIGNKYISPEIKYAFNASIEALEHMEKQAEIYKVIHAIVRDSEPFEADKVFIHCENLRKIMRG